MKTVRGAVIPFRCQETDSSCCKGQRVIQQGLSLPAEIHTTSQICFAFLQQGLCVAQGFDGDRLDCHLLSIGVAELIPDGFDEDKAQTVEARVCFLHQGKLFPHHDSPQLTIAPFVRSRLSQRRLRLATKGQNTEGTD